MDGDGNNKERLLLLSKRMEKLSRRRSSITKRFCLTRAFKREAYFHTKYTLRVLVVYIGDSSVQVPRPHGKY